MTEANTDQGMRRLQTIGWWLATIVTLVVLDDLTFGPFFWLVSRTAGPLTAVGAVFLIYVPAQVFLVRRATSPEPGRVATFFLRRLELERSSAQIAHREQLLKARVLGTGSALAMTLLIGGVLPPIMLWRAGYGTQFVRRLSYLTAPVYAAEFATLHGLLPSLF